MEKQRLCLILYLPLGGCFMEEAEEWGKGVVQVFLAPSLWEMLGSCLQASPVPPDHSH